MQDRKEGHLLGPIKGYFPTPDNAYTFNLTSDIGVQNKLDIRHSEISLETLISTLTFGTAKN